jgi:hypothetical protein
MGRDRYATVTNAGHGYPKQEDVSVRMPVVKSFIGRNCVPVFMLKDKPQSQHGTVSIAVSSCQYLKLMGA